MILACIDIGTNTTRLLVADVQDGRLRKLKGRRVFTRIGKSMRSSGQIPPEKVAETAKVAAEQAELAGELGAVQLEVVATAAIRDAPNRQELADSIERSCDAALRVVSGEEEARLSFVGAVRTFPEPLEGAVAVADVGGGSSELAIGDPDGTVRWSASYMIGSGLLADSHLVSDPPSGDEIEAVRNHVQATFADLRPPPAAVAMAVGGTANSLRRLLGGELDHDSLERGLELLAATTVADVAASHKLDPERVRLLPAGVLVLEAMSDALRLPLRVARGGLREGVLLEVAEARSGA